MRKNPLGHKNGDDFPLDALKKKVSKNDKVSLWSKAVDKKVLREQHYQVIGFKPNGIWYACGTAWAEWLLEEMPEWLEDVKYAYKLTFPKHKVLHLTSASQLRSFTKQYSAGPYNIAWELVAQEYSGIEICPYQHSCRFDLLWYYGWDVASGCIWDPSIIAMVEEVVLDG